MNRTPAPANVTSLRTTEELTHEERAVLNAIRDTSYGAVEVVMHQARIVQIVRTEKLRLEPHPASP
jgi:hypothetical protein